MKKLSNFSKPSQRKLLIILSSTRLHYCKKEKGQTIDLKNDFQVEGYSNSANTYDPTTPEHYFRQQYFENLDLIISSVKDRFNQPAFMAFLKMEQLLLNIILNNNYENELAYLFNVCKDNIDPMQVQMEALCLPCFKEVIVKIFLIS